MTSAHTPRYTASSTAARSTAFGLAAVVTLSLLSGLGQVADHQHDQALLAQADGQPVQVVVVTGKLPRSV